MNAPTASTTPTASTASNDFTACTHEYPGFSSTLPELDAHWFAWRRTRARA